MIRKCTDEDISDEELEKVINPFYDKEISYDIKEINDFFDISYGELKKVLNSIEE